MLSFQQRFVPSVEDVMVTVLDGGPAGFAPRLASGEVLGASRVVIATGVSHAAYVPAELAGLPAELTSHSSAQHDLSRFAGRHVTVIGAGQSARWKRPRRCAKRGPTYSWSWPPALARLERALRAGPSPVPLRAVAPAGLGAGSGARAVALL